MSAKLPVELLEEVKPKYTVRTMPVGSMHYTGPRAMVVDSDLGCYLIPDMELSDSGFVTVRRDETGYHVSARAAYCKWAPQEISPDQKQELIPVQTVVATEG